MKIGKRMRGMGKRINKTERTAAKSCSGRFSMILAVTVWAVASLMAAGFVDDLKLWLSVVVNLALVVFEVLGIIIKEGT